MTFEQRASGESLENQFVLGEEVNVQEADGSESMGWKIMQINPGNKNTLVKRDLVGGEEELKRVPQKQLRKVSVALYNEEPIKKLESPDIAHARTWLEIEDKYPILAASEVFGSELVHARVRRHSGQEELWTIDYCVLDQSGQIMAIVLQNLSQQDIRKESVGEFLELNKGLLKKITDFDERNRK